MINLGFHPILAAAGSPAIVPVEGSWTLLIVYFTLAIGISFFCSVWEAVLLSLSRPYIAAKKESHPAVGAMLENLKEDINAPLTSILTLNTIAHTVGAMGVGAQVAALVGGGWLETLAGAIMTLAILILSEIIPKNLGARHWQAWGPWVGRCLAVLSKVMTPFVKLVSIFSAGGHARPEISREELRVMAEIGREDGNLQENELLILQNLLNLSETTIHEAMTPRTVVFALPRSVTVGQFIDEHLKTPFSRIPIFGADIDNIEGFVLKIDILTAAATGGREDAPLSEFIRELPMLPATTPIPKAFEQFMEDQSHIAIVLDEFGGVDGLISMEDILETLLGLEIVDEADTTTDMQKRARILARRRARAKAAAVAQAPGSASQ